MSEEITRDEMHLAIVKAVNKSEKTILKEVRGMRKEVAKDNQVLYDKVITKLNGVPHRLTIAEKDIDDIEKDAKLMVTLLNAHKVETVKRTNFWGGIGVISANVTAFFTAFFTKQ